MTVGNRLHMGSARRVLALVAAMAMLFAMVPLVGAAFAQEAEDDRNFRLLDPADDSGAAHLEGPDNVSAAIAWSQVTFDESDHVFLGRDDVFADNLASGSIQGIFEGPLLVTSSDDLADDVVAELERLDAQTVHILGGLAAISQEVEDEVSDLGYNIHRHAGATRIETAIDIAGAHAADSDTALLSRAFGTAGGDETQAFADALAGGGWAASEGWPVLFTQTEELNENTAAYLADSDVDNVIVLGGTAAVSAAVVAELEAQGLNVDRVGGANRFDTAVMVAEERGFDDAGDTDAAILVEGQASDAWIDGFAAAAFSGLHDAPIVLSNGENLPPETEAWLEHDGSHDMLLICGAKVNDAACEEAADILGLDMISPRVPTGPQINFGAAQRGEPITVSVTGVEEGQTVAFAGDCIEDESFTVAAGTEEGDTVNFTLQPSGTQEEGDCVITVTITDADGETVFTDTFTVTITAPPAQQTFTDAPELQTVSERVRASDRTSVNFTFDSAASGITPVQGSFNLVSWDGQIFEPVIQPVVDPNNANTIVATFDTGNYDSATTGAVDAGAVQNPDGVANPEGDAPLKSVTVAGGRTDGFDLVSVGNFNATTGTVDFTMDSVVSTAPAVQTGFRLVFADGQESVSATAAPTSPASETVRASFTGGLNAAQWANVRRAYVVHDAILPNTAAGSVNVAAGGTTNAGIPDPMSVVFREQVDSPAGSSTMHVDIVEFTFNEAVTVADGTRLSVYHQNGESRPAIAAARTSTTTVEATFLAGTLAGAVSAVADEGAVTAVAVGNAPNNFRSLNRANVVHAAGTTVAANPTDATVAVGTTTVDPVTGAQTVTSYDITVNFDRPLMTNPLAADFAVYSQAGSRTSLTGGTVTRVDQDTIRIRTTQAQVTAVANAVLLGFEGSGNVSYAHGNFGYQAEAHPTSFGITAP